MHTPSRQACSCSRVLVDPAAAPNTTSAPVSPKPVTTGPATNALCCAALIGMLTLGTANMFWTRLQLELCVNE